MSSVYSGSAYFASYGNDMQADPPTQDAIFHFTNSGSPASVWGQNWTVSLCACAPEQQHACVSTFLQICGFPT